jgi:hypothetical protein
MTMASAVPDGVEVGRRAGEGHRGPSPAAAATLADIVVSTEGWTLAATDL